MFTMSKNLLFNLPSALKLVLILSLPSTIYAKSPVPSPEAHTELICHTQHASECYPAIFQPTIHFKPIHDDQSLPPGLHVRMNLATGLKEARLNVPEPDGVSKADLVIIDDVKLPKIEGEREEDEVKEVEEEPVQVGGIHDQSTPDRDYPYIPDALDAEESSLFDSATSALLSSSPPISEETLLSTLTALTDLLHSHHWGLTFTSSRSLVQKLLSTLNQHPSSPSSNSNQPINPETRSQAALLLGTAIQNNPEARSALLSHFPSSDDASADDNRKPDDTIIRAVLSTLQEPVSVVTPPTLHSRTLFLLHQLAYSTSQLHSFISSSGLSTLQTLFDAEGMRPSEDSRDKLRQRVANFMLDHILPALEGDKGRDLAISIIELSENVVDGSESIMASRKRGEGNGNREAVLLKVLEPWSIAFGHALEEYAVFMYGKEEGSVPGVFNAYSSVWEATLLLKKILGIP